MRKGGKREDLIFNLEFYYNSQLDKKLERCVLRFV